MVVYRTNGEPFVAHKTIIQIVICEMKERRKSNKKKNVGKKIGIARVHTHAYTIQLPT